MNNKDLYEILGISRNASENEIKKAYKKLALKWHPDRQGGKSDKEKKEAEEKFKDIGFAYSILSDPEKKQRYDQFGITDDQQQTGGGFDPEDIFKHFMRDFSDMFDGNNPFSSFFGRKRKNEYQSAGQSIKMQIPVSIEEICKGIHKDIKYDINSRCSSCNGIGGDKIETCPYCHGTGMITQTKRFGGQFVQSSHPCQYCNGTGTIIKNKCNKCNGTGFVKKEESVRIDLNPGFNNGYQKYFDGKGYESKIKGLPNGDLILEFIYNYDTSKYSVQGNTLYEIIELPYYNCILGDTIQHKTPDDSTISITIPPYSKDNTLVNTSKTFGSLRYTCVIKVKMPTYINKNEKELLIKLKNENK